MSRQEDTPRRPPFSSLPLDANGPPGNAWGLYGPDDRIGALNLLTPVVVASAAASEIRTGERVSLDWPLNKPSHPSFGRAPFKSRLVNRTGPGTDGTRTRCVNDDILHFNTQCSSQWDGFRHYGYQKAMRYYNNVSHEDLETPEAIGIDAWVENGGGIIGRGILLDYAGFCKRHSVALDAMSSTGIPLEHLVQVAEEEKVVFRPGDVLFIRAGFTEAYDGLDTAQQKALAERRSPDFIGVEPTRCMLEWIWNTGFAAVASDAPSFERAPIAGPHTVASGGDGGGGGGGGMWAGEPWEAEMQGGGLLHQWLLGGWGMPIGEMFDLEELGRRGRRPPVMQREDVTLQEDHEAPQQMSPEPANAAPPPLAAIPSIPQAGSNRPSRPLCGAGAGIRLNFLCLALHGGSYDIGAEAYAEPATSADDMSARYFLAADHQLSKERGAVRLISIQARLYQCFWLLSQSHINHCWTLFGTVAYLALAIGLNRNRHADSASTYNLVELEYHRRTFWCAYRLNNYLSSTLGNPRTFHDEDIHQELPSSSEDHHIRPHRILPGPARGQSIIFAPVAHVKPAFPIKLHGRSSLLLSDSTLVKAKEAIEPESLHCVPSAFKLLAETVRGVAALKRCKLVLYVRFEIPATRGDSKSNGNGLVLDLPQLEESLLGVFRSKLRYASLAKLTHFFDLLARHLYAIRIGEWVKQEDEINQMSSMPKKYSDFAEHKPGTITSLAEIVILTGAAGSLGPHILAQPMRELASRKSTIWSARQTSRMPSTASFLSWHPRGSHNHHPPPEGETSSARSHVKFLLTDLSLLTLGVDDAVLSTIRDSLTTVVHSAWAVNFNLGVASFETQHIRGLHNLVNFCLGTRTERLAWLFFCSSVSVAAGTTPPPVVSETYVADPTKAIPLMIQSAMSIGALPAFEGLSSAGTYAIFITRQAPIDITGLRHGAQPRDRRPRTAPSIHSWRADSELKMEHCSAQQDAWLALASVHLVEGAGRAYEKLPLPTTKGTSCSLHWRMRCAGAFSVRRVPSHHHPIEFCENPSFACVEISAFKAQALSHWAGVEIDLSVPKEEIKRRDQKRFQAHNLEVDLKNLGWGVLKGGTGRFKFKVKHNGKTLTEQFLDVDPISGDVRSKSSMDDTMNETKSILDKELVVSYGAYEAGTGTAGLPNRHQVYVAVTQNWSAWQGLVAPDGSAAAKKPFHRLVLPCPHDVGMNSMDTINAILKHAGTAAAAMLVNLAPYLKGAQKEIGAILSGLSDVTAAQIAPSIIASLAITQKDTLTTMLSSGARYFEFRPAHCHQAILPHSPLPDKLYFQHGPIPGMAYDAFLMDLVHFLAAHPTEIAVVHERWDGVPAECAKPSDDELKGYHNAALALSNGAIAQGNLDDLKKRTIGELRDSKKRLIVIKNVGVLSTYDDNANATTDGKSILAAWEKTLTRDNEKKHNFTVAQVQATPTNLEGVIKYSVLTASASTMALMSTKGMCDHMMLPWARDNLDKRLGRDKLLCIMNDFLEGATTDVAVDLSKKRLRD
ncbi:hypothetical protein MKZ38_003851 [Zalerion maritima]|uniref:Xylanolytic transcriptional activator regulatory domain-containing protein n=1 Tax=Zalerion maritima TaxID=339359 RepID=A0AAD5RNA5_9PEZI|nr:hypothetical protein MKZ38_003851 [Zalerion maritima]